VYPIVLFVPRVQIALNACFSSAIFLFEFVLVKYNKASANIKSQYRI